MGMLKSLIMLALLFTPAAPLVIGFWVLKYGVKFIIWDAKLMFNLVFLLFIGIPEMILWIIFYLILYQGILKGILGVSKFSAHWLEWIFGHFDEGLKVVENNIERAGQIMVFWGLFLVFVFPIEFSIDFLLNGWQTIITLIAAIFLPIIIGSAILNKVKDGKLTETARQTARNVRRRAPGQAEKAADGVYNQLGSGAAGAAGAVESAKEIDEAAEGIKWFPDNIRRITYNLAKLFKLVGKKGAKTAEKAAARQAERGAVSYAAAGTQAAEAISYTSMLPYILICILIGGIVVAVQLVVIGGLFWGFLNFWLPVVAGPVMGVIGFGEAYAQWGGQSASNQLAPQLDGAFEEEKRALAQVGAKFGCMLEGPQCLRQWELNNTVRPGSEEVGRTYELRIDQFGIGNDRIDKAYKEKAYTLPINFLVSNTRHGLKGIPARNVRYRISVEDATNRNENAYCSTGWKRMDTGTGDEILPGLGVSPTENLDDLNLGNCGLLQPSLGVNRVLTMEVKYNYSSQATLYFDAMSRQYRREQGIQPGFKKSETAKTPVQSYINIQSPVTFFETEAGPRPRRAVPFAARFGFETPGFDVRYKVHPDSVKIYDSSLTEVTSMDDCTGLQRSGEGDNIFDISERAKERITDRQSETWFDRSISPAPLRCTMQISDDAVNSISPTGEQLIMRIDGNYTVVREQQHTGFNVVNTRCTRINCPMLVTDEYNESHEGLMYDTCDYGSSVDSYDGCTVIIPEEDSDFRDDTRPGHTQNGDINWANPEVATTGDGREMIIEQGETAYRAETITDMVTSVNRDDEDGISRGFITHKDVGDLSGVMGLTQEEKSKFETGSGTNFIVYKEERNDGRATRIAYSELQTDAEVCEGYVSGQRQSILNHLEDRQLPQGGELLAYGLNTRDCADQAQALFSAAECGVDLVSEGVQAITGWNAVMEGGGLLTGDTKTACHRIKNKLDTAVKGCDGAIVYFPDRERYQCWEESS